MLLLNNLTQCSVIVVSSDTSLAYFYFFIMYQLLSAALR